MTELVASAARSGLSAERATAVPAFANAVELHKAMVYSIAWHFLRDRIAAEDLAQDVFLELHRHWISMKSAEHLLFWLRKVTSNRCIDTVRRRRSHNETSIEDSAEPTALERVQDPLLARYLERMVASLPEKPRMVVVLRYQEGLEPEEIARVLGMNASTVKSQLSRALELLRAKTAQKLKQGMEDRVE